MASEPVKVLHVLGYFDRGGAEAMVMNLYRNIDPAKVTFGFVVHGDRIGAFEKEVSENGADVFRVPDYTGKNHLKYKQSWESIFKKHPEYTVIHGHVRSTANIYLKIAQRFNVKTIAHSHNTSSGEGLSATIKNLFQKGIKKQSDYLLGCSMDAGKWLFGENVINQSNFYVLNNAINAQEFVYNEKMRLAKRKELGLTDKFVVGHVGRFHEQKNHSFLIEIFKSLVEMKADSVLLLVGAGDEKERIEDQVNKLGLQERVKFLGLRSDIAELLQAMDVFLFPSLFEGLPVTLVETQAAALPAVVSDTITKEIELTRYISYMPLSASPSRWADQLVEKADNSKRENTLSEIKCARYDIESSAAWYTQFILDM